MKLNLEALRKLSEDVMTDTVVIRRNAQGEFDDNTGTYTATTENLYEGKATIYPEKSQPLEQEEGGQGQHHNRYWVTIPVNVNALIVPEDEVEVLTSQRDALLPGRKMLVESVEISTYAVTRRIRTRMVVPVP